MLWLFSVTLAAPVLVNTSEPYLHTAQKFCPYTTADSLARIKSLRSLGEGAAPAFSSDELDAMFEVPQPELLVLEPADAEATVMLGLARRLHQLRPGLLQRQAAEAYRKFPDSVNASIYLTLSRDPELAERVLLSKPPLDGALVGAAGAILLCDAPQRLETLPNRALTLLTDHDDHMGRAFPKDYQMWVLGYRDALLAELLKRRMHKDAVRVARAEIDRIQRDSRCNTVGYSIRYPFAGLTSEHTCAQELGDMHAVLRVVGERGLPSHEDALERLRACPLPCEPEWHPLPAAPESCIDRAFASAGVTAGTDVAAISCPKK